MAPVADRILTNLGLKLARHVTRIKKTNYRPMHPDGAITNISERQKLYITAYLATQITRPTASNITSIATSIISITVNYWSKKYVMHTVSPHS